MKIFWHKLRHWEYWPAYVIYFPTFLYWVYNGLKFLDFNFYKFSNPVLKNGGLFKDGKTEIYNYLHSSYYPKTIFISKEIETNLDEIIRENQFKFPLIAKPNDGFRGIGVEKIYDLDALLRYHKEINKDYLIQEYIEYPNEIGVFYCKIPGEIEGKITGITGKKFLSIKGDGVSNMRGLLQQNPRFKMQISTLEKEFNLEEVLQNGEERQLVPYGNHSRGTEFTDFSSAISLKLTRIINSVLNDIPEFYYGRIDLKFSSIEELEKGLNFSIIEINGAKSEPAHIYDTSFSFLDAQKEIFRHQRLFMKIIKINKLRNKVWNGSTILNEHMI